MSRELLYVTTTTAQSTRPCGLDHDLRGAGQAATCPAGGLMPEPPDVHV